MAITASIQPKLGWIVYAGSIFLHPIQFHFSKEGLNHFVQNRPGSWLDGLVRFWPNRSGLEASPNHLAQFCEMATGLLPITHFQTQLHSSTEGPHHNYCAEPTQIWFWLTVLGFGQCGPLLASTSEPIWIWCESDLACLLGKLGHLVLCAASPITCH